MLQNVESQRRFSAADSEPCDCGERLELLAVVRGLEALDGPSRVTLVTKSRYVSRGIKKGLAEWRANDWKWERFGRIVPVRDTDLWRRVDRALQFHQVSCQAWQFESIEVEQESRFDFEVDRGEIPIISPRSRRRVDAPHRSRGPRVVQRLKRRARSQAASFSDAIRSVTRPLQDAAATAT
ncbi:MAG: RNase H family protein [Planctomycetota bacterium]